MTQFVHGKTETPKLQYKVTSGVDLPFLPDGIPCCVYGFIISGIWPECSRESNLEDATHIGRSLYSHKTHTHTHTSLFKGCTRSHNSPHSLLHRMPNLLNTRPSFGAKIYICIFKKVHSSSLSGSHPFSVWIGTREPLLTQPKRASGFFQNKETYNYLEELRLEKYECSNNKLQAKVQIRSTKLF